MSGQIVAEGPSTGRTDAQPELPRLTGWLFRWFAGIARRELRKGFASIRLLDGRAFPVVDPARPVIVYLNHPSWWDPLVCIHATRRFLNDRRAFGPIDAEALRDYPLFKRLGFFGIERDTVAGARRFLQVSTRICQEPATVLWMTPEGGFRDSSLRPVELTAGLSRLLVRLRDRGVEPLVVPMALHYGFLEQKRPELFLAFGPALDPGSLRHGRNGCEVSESCSGAPCGNAGEFEDSARLPHEVPGREVPGQEARARAGDPMAQTPRTQPIGDDPERWLREPLERRLDELLEVVRERDFARLPEIESGARGLHPVYDRLRAVFGMLRGRRVHKGHGGRGPQDA